MSESKQAETTKYDVGNGRMMTIAEIAELTTISRQGIRKRLNNGVIGVDLLEPAQDRASGASSNWAIFKQRWADAEEQGLSEEQKKWKANGYQNGGLYITPTGAWPDYLGPFPSPRR